MKSVRPFPYKELTQGKIINDSETLVKEKKTESIGKIVNKKNRYFNILNKKKFDFLLLGIRRILYVKRNWKDFFPFFHYK